MVKRPHVGLWPARSQPHDGELLSSWIARLAAAHGLSYARFCQRAWGGRSIWQSDIDLYADEGIVQVIANKTGVSKTVVLATTLGGLQGWLFPTAKPSRATEWILPARIFRLRKFDRTAVIPGAYVRQYCKMCLDSDDLPYFRLHWRLAFVTMCDRHGLDLNDRCPDCDGPVVPTDADLLRHRDVRLDHQALCFRCGSDLRKATSGTAGVDLRDLFIQRKLTEALKSRWMEVAPGLRVPSALYFPVLRQLVNLVSHGNRGVEVRSVVGKECELDDYEPSGGPEPIFEHLPRTDRRAVLRMAIWLLRSWPTRFVETSALIQRYPLSRGQFPGTPLWFRNVLDAVAKPTRHYVSRAEIEWILRRTGHKFRAGGSGESGDKQARPRRQRSDTVMSRSQRSL